MSALMTYNTHNSDVTFLLMVSVYMVLVEDFSSECCRSDFGKKKKKKRGFTDAELKAFLYTADQVPLFVYYIEVK